MELDELRAKIDVIDEGVIELLGARAKVVAEIKRYKDENGLDVFDSSREDALFERVRSAAVESGLDEDFVERVFGEIVSESKRLQSLED